MSGTPFSLSADPTSSAAIGNASFVNVSGPITIAKDYRAGESYFSSSNISAPAPNTIGNSGRNTTRGPGLHVLDLALMRRFEAGERVGIDFRAEVYNVTNSPQFRNPVNLFNASNFGRLTSTINNEGEREFQFGVRIVF